MVFGLILKADCLKQNLINIIEIYKLKQVQIQIKFNFIKQAYNDLSSFKKTESLLPLLNFQQHQITLSDILAFNKNTIS